MNLGRIMDPRESEDLNRLEDDLANSIGIGRSRCQLRFGNFDQFDTSGFLNMTCQQVIPLDRVR